MTAFPSPKRPSPAFARAPQRLEAALASQVMEDAWDAIGKIASRLDDASVLPPGTGRLLRIMKLTEEVGEVTQAAFGRWARTRARASRTPPGTTSRPICAP